jgi:hypothetical protein
MAKENNSETAKVLEPPNRLFLFSVTVGLVTPFVARIAGIPLEGIDWFTAYFTGGFFGFLFISAFNLVPSITWYLLGAAGKRFPLAFWASVAGGVAYLLYAHRLMNLSSSSTAALGLVFIPVVAVGAILASWVVGLLLHFIIRQDHIKYWAALCIGVIAIAYGFIAPEQQSREITARESRFPYLAISNIPLQKTNILGDEHLGGVFTFSVEHSHKTSQTALLALTRSHIYRIDPADYDVLSKINYQQEDCDGCVHMYPYLTTDKNGSPLVSTSDGVSDQNGQLKWQWKASGFSRVVPIPSKDQGVRFLSYQSTDRIVLHDTDGKELWQKNIDVSDIGIYTTPNGARLPFAITGYKAARKLTVYNLDGSIERSFKLPDWAMDAQSVSWPEPGNLLVGAGRHFAVLDAEGNEIFSHTIQDTSFNPYHGPYGTSVVFNKDEKPLLAVTCRGSSGYARSVLLIFDSEGVLVWKEELKKLWSIIALPISDEGEEVLLVGGMEGIIEYKPKSERAIEQIDSGVEPTAPKTTETERE